jgi:hypothetical protein
MPLRTTPFPQEQYISTIIEMWDLTASKRLNPLKLQGFSSMTKHYILSINPNAEYEWDQYILRDPLTAGRPDFASLIAEAVGDETGSYLVSVNIEVKVLEKTQNPQPQRVPVDIPAVTTGPHPSELVA